jgi:hypothetical protein
MKYTFWKCLGALLMLGLPFASIWQPAWPDQDPSLLASYSYFQASVSRLGFGLVSFAGGFLILIVADLSRRLREAQARIEKLEGNLWHGGRLQSAETRIEQLEEARRDENGS